MSRGARDIHSIDHFSTCPHPSFPFHTGAPFAYSRDLFHAFSANSPCFSASLSVTYLSLEQHKLVFHYFWSNVYWNEPSHRLFPLRNVQSDLGREQGRRDHAPPGDDQPLHAGISRCRMSWEDWKFCRSARLFPTRSPPRSRLWKSATKPSKSSSSSSPSLRRMMTSFSSSTWSWQPRIGIRRISRHSSFSIKWWGILRAGNEFWIQILKLSFQCDEVRENMRQIGEVRMLEARLNVEKRRNERMLNHINELSKQTIMHLTATRFYARVRVPLGSPGSLSQLSGTRCNASDDGLDSQRVFCGLGGQVEGVGWHWSRESDASIEHSLADQSVSLRRFRRLGIFWIPESTLRTVVTLLSRMATIGAARRESWFW